MNKTYIAYDDGKIGYIESICNCDRCKERKHTEISIHDLDGNYLDYITLKDMDGVIYIGRSLDQSVDALSEYYRGIIQQKEKENRNMQEIVRLYESKLL